MKQKAKHRKVFYVPGMISLVFIPFLFFCYLHYNKPLKIERAMDFALPDKAMVAKFESDFPKMFKRKFDEFHFNGSLETDKSELSKFQILLRKRNAIKDTVAGIKLHFGKKMTYEVFIKVLDILTIENTPTYGMFKNNELLVINAAASELKLEEIRRRKEAEINGQVILTKPPCGNPEYEAGQRALEREYRERTERENFRKSYFNNHWYVFLAYFCLALLNIYMLIKFNKNRIYNQKPYI